MTPYASSRSNNFGPAAGWMLCFLAWAGPAFALDLGESVQVHGFLSQAAAISDHNDIGGNSSDGIALELREIGANVSWRPTPDWLLSAQTLMRWSGIADDGDLRLDYGFVDRALMYGDYRLGMQLGKI